MSDTFALMNVLIKGTAASIKSALEKIGSKPYELHTFTYDPKNVDPSDTAIVKVGLVFEKWYEGYISKDEIPFASMPEIKFIGLGNGGDGYRTDGSYVFFKDFGETSISECYQFTRVSPLMEEFDGQDDVLDEVLHSFMDHTWEFEFEDYSCGEYMPYGFDDEDLVEKWGNDHEGNDNREADMITTSKEERTTSADVSNDMDSQDSHCKFLTTVNDEQMLLKHGFNRIMASTISNNVVLLGVENCDSEVVIPDGVQIIGYRAFAKCSQLEKVVLPDSCCEVYEDAFAECFNLKVVSFKEGTAIYPVAFTNTIPWQIVKTIDFQMRKADGSVKSIPASKCLID